MEIGSYLSSPRDANSEAGMKQLSKGGNNFRKRPLIASSDLSFPATAYFQGIQRKQQLCEDVELLTAAVKLSSGNAAASTRLT
jgi:hypothetical protein